MTIFRLTKARYQDTAFEGIGSLQSPGRWHPVGIPVVYAADAPSSALLEILVHTEAAALLEQAYVLFTVELDPERHLLVLEPEVCPPDWRRRVWPSSTQQLGARWFADQDSVALQVPSAVLPQQRNYLINLRHPQFEELVITGPEVFEIDPRLGA